MKKLTTKLIALFVVALMICSMLPMHALAASWDPDDQITINVRVYDQATGNAYSIGTDYARKGDQYIQSDPYTIPQLSKFTSNSYGRVIKVAGNWYFPSGDQQVGATVNWSCNTSSVTMTYWVTAWNPGTGSGGSSDETIDLGGSGKYSLNFTINYHSNYPDGTDYVVAKHYRVLAYTQSYNVFSSQFPTYEDCGFGGFNPKSTTHTWYRDAACSETAGTVYASNGGTYDLYAGWETGATPLPTVTLTYKDGNEIYATQSFLAGDTVTVINCTNVKEGYTFQGWSTTPDGAVEYIPDDGFTIQTNTTLYAVWEKNTPDPTDPDPTDPGPTDPDPTDPDPTDPVEKISEPGMDKKVNGKDNDTAAANDELEYTLNSTVPESLKDYIWGEAGNAYTLTFHDQMDSNLILNGDPTVTIDEATIEIDGEMVKLEKTCEDGCCFELTMDLLALYNAGYIHVEDLGTAPIVVSYSATVKENVVGPLTNTAWTDYENGKSEKDVVTVDVYGIEVFKHNEENTGLKGAIFGLYRDKDCNDKILELVTDGKGNVTCNGLAAGTYYLKELKAPEGYIKSDSPVMVEIPADSTEHVIHVDFVNAEIPHTGGAGTTVYTITGVSILAVAAVLFLLSRKKQIAGTDK